MSNFRRPLRDLIWVSCFSRTEIHWQKVCIFQKVLNSTGLPVCKSLGEQRLAYCIYSRLSRPADKPTRTGPYNYQLKIRNNCLVLFLCKSYFSILNPRPTLFLIIKLSKKTSAYSQVYTVVKNALVS